MKIKKNYKTAEINDDFRFSNVKIMSLNDVLLRILNGGYEFYDSTIDYDIIWIKKNVTEKMTEKINNKMTDYYYKWVHIETKIV